MQNLKIATYNVNGIGARLPNLLQWLERERPDIVCLQELKAQDKAFPAAELEAAGYGSLHHGQASWNGVAILARDSEPLRASSCGCGQDASHATDFSNQLLQPIPHHPQRQQWRAQQLAAREGAVRDLGEQLYRPAVTLGDGLGEDPCGKVSHVQSMP